MVSEQTAGLKNTEKKTSFFFFKCSTDNDGKGLFRVYRAGTVHCLKAARRPYNVGETREVRGQRKPQMCRLGPPERTSGTFSDISGLCFSRVGHDVTLGNFDSPEQLQGLEKRSY